MLFVNYTHYLFGQSGAIVKGIVYDTDGKVLSQVFVHAKNERLGVFTNDSGSFKIDIASQKLTVLLFEHVNFETQQKSFLLKTGEQEKVNIFFKEKINNLADVEVRTNAGKRDIGAITLRPDKAILNPSPIGGIEGIIKTYVGSNNELSSNYNVRGGNYDENLIYVNDYEIFRPFLISTAQQEGLSFINPFLTDNVKFFTGGFQAKYGDKMSSVLDVAYKKPEDFGGTVYIGQMEQGIHLEGVAGNKKNFSYLIGLRNRNNKNILQSQETTGNYIPSSADVQTFISWHISSKWALEFLGNYAQTKFSFYPKESQLTSNVLSPFFNANYGLQINFEGSEKDKYATNFAGITAIQKVNKNIELKWMLSRFEDNETENTDIRASYLFGESASQSGSGLDIENILGAGINHQFARNKLNIQLLSAQHRGSWNVKNNFIQWGITIDRQKIHDVLNKWVYVDSAGYALPYDNGGPTMFDLQKGSADIEVMRYSSFIQDNIRFKNDLLLNVGVRVNYNDLNKEIIFSPRAGLSYSPKSWEKDFVFRASAGMYVQPPFYRELRRYNGSINKEVKSQKSLQGTAAVDYNFTMFNRPAKWSTEVYYKYLYDVNPYDIDNVRIRYYGNNDGKGYAAGIETRLFGELVKDAESWISIGLMQTKEKIEGLTFTNYLNASGQIINNSTTDKVVVDSILQKVGWVRRPSDRLITFGMFFQDYLSSNNNFKVYLNSIFGSNLPYNLPDNNRFRNALTIPAYLRIDIGFSALLLDAKKIRRSYSPFKDFKNIWATLEVFNLINKSNTISYTSIKDFSNNIYIMPNRLTPRLLNFKIVAEW